MLLPGDTCTECGTRVGTWGCCPEIRRLSRQVHIARQVAKSVRRAILNAGGMEDHTLQTILKELDKVI